MTMMEHSGNALCRRHAYDLCRHYGISADAMAPVFGISRAEFEQRVRDDGLTLDDLQGGNSDVTLVRDLMALLHRELEQLQLGDETATAKTRLDALAQLARTMDRLSDMQEKRVEQQRSMLMLSPDELREALVRIDGRIHELALCRADELVQRQSQPAADPGHGRGMDVSRPDEPAAAAS
ncbi:MULTISPECIES: hypothetical protein [Phyllobacterium]|uniref:hypothetical protein n=1 Tax=Phyllobacterium TaxID=28100 RepID=UPI0010299FDC|nr:hypothetical protein [Phyllobacterium myrsinacearum]RZS88547.1 hypothetical protein EV217_0933 [Phyllobacterium myrsinacearum]